MSLVHTYALIKTIYDNQKDLLITMCPLIINVLAENNNLSVNKIQEDICKKHGVLIPLKVIESILNRCSSQKGWVDSRHNLYYLTEEGEKACYSMETDRDIRIKNNRLFRNIKEYLEKNGVNKEESEIEELVNAFLNNNLFKILEFMNPKAKEEIRVGKIESEDEVLIAKAIRNIFEYEIDIREHLENIIKGLMLSAALYAPKNREIDDLIKRKFKHLTVYLDSNIIFSLFSWHSETMKKSADELFEYLKKFNIHIAMLDITIDEIKSVLHYYVNNYYYKIPHGIDIDSVYGYLKKSGKSLTEIYDIILNIETKIKETGIEIQTVSQDSKYKKSDEREQRIGRLSAIKNAGARSVAHDIDAIECISYKRNRKKYSKLEECGFVFVTSDIKLAKYNYYDSEYENVEKIAIPEVVTDGYLLNVLWMKDPSLEIPIYTMIKYYALEQLVDQKVWDRFFEILQNTANGEEADIPSLMSVCDISTLEKSLIYYNDKIDEMDNEAVVDIIERSTRRAEEKIEKAEKDRAQAKTELEKEREKNIALEEEMKRRAEEKEREKEIVRIAASIELIEHQKDDIVREAKISSCKTYSFYKNIVVVSAFVCLIPLFIYLTKNWGTLEAAYRLLALGFSGLFPAIYALDKKWGKKIKGKIEDKKRINENKKYNTEERLEKLMSEMQKYETKNVPCGE